MIFWSAMRFAAIQRHAFVNLACGGNPYAWNYFHMPMIRAVYGW